MPIELSRVSALKCTEQLSGTQLQCRRPCTCQYAPFLLFTGLNMHTYVVQDMDVLSDGSNGPSIVCGNQTVPPPAVSWYCSLMTYSWLITSIGEVTSITLTSDGCPCRSTVWSAMGITWRTGAVLHRSAGDSVCCSLESCKEQCSRYGAVVAAAQW